VTCRDRGGSLLRPDTGVSASSSTSRLAGRTRHLVIAMLWTTSFNPRLAVRAQSRSVVAVLASRLGSRAQRFLSIGAKMRLDPRSDGRLFRARALMFGLRLLLCADRAAGPLLVNASRLLRSVPGSRPAGMARYCIQHLALGSDSGEFAAMAATLSSRARPLAPPSGMARFAAFPGGSFRFALLAPAVFRRLSSASRCCCCFVACQSWFAGQPLHANDHYPHATVGALFVFVLVSRPAVPVFDRALEEPPPRLLDLGRAVPVRSWRSITRSRIIPL